MPRVRLTTFPCGSRMSVRHSTPSYPPLAMMVGSSDGLGAPDPSVGGTRIHASARIADWCTEMKCVGKMSEGYQRSLRWEREQNLEDSLGASPLSNASLTL